METVYIKGQIDTKALANEPCVMALGFFDGVHLGHRELIQTSKEIAEQKNLAFSVMTFFPHPSNVLPARKKIDRYLSPLDAKKAVFKELGVEKLFIVEFSEEFAKLSPADFVQRYINGLNCRHVVAGFDFTYGYKGLGNMERMIEDGRGFFDITVVEKKSYKNEKISSTKIRELLKGGAVNDIRHYLGYYYCTHARIENERVDLKSQLTILSVSFGDYMLPRKGKYLVRLECGQEIHEGICDLFDDISGTHKIFIFSGAGLKLPVPVKVEWITELESLSLSEAAELSKRNELVV